MCSLKTLVALLAAAAGVAVAAPTNISGILSARQNSRDTIISALTRVSGSLQQLDISVRALSPVDGGISAAQLLTAAQGAQRATEDAAAMIRSVDDLSLGQAR